MDSASGMICTSSDSGSAFGQDEVEVLLDWCRSIVGSIVEVVPAGHDHGNAQVFRITSSSGLLYLKHHRAELRWRNELSAYETFVRAIADYAPRLVAARDQPPRAILLTALEGTAMFRTALDPGQRTAAWFRAGVCLAGLHGLTGERFGLCAPDVPDPNGFDGASGPEAFRRYASHWIDAGVAAGILSPHEQRLGLEALRYSSLFAGQPPLACHRDFTPRNWIVDGHGTWRGVVDFELSVWGMRALDMDRWWDNYFTIAPECERSFFDGYGTELSDENRHQVTVARVVNAVHQIVWGAVHGDADFQRRGREALVRLEPLIRRLPG